MESAESQCNTNSLFASLILPVPIPELFTYRVPEKLSKTIAIGQRAIVPFGVKKILTGVIAHVHQEVPSGSYQIKEILDLVGEDVILHPYQLKLYRWIAGYYMCTIGEVLHAALPAGLNISSESMVQLAPCFDWEEASTRFSEKEYMVLNRLTQGTARCADLSRQLGIKNIYYILKSLSEKKNIILFEQIRERYHPKKKKYIRLSSSFLGTKQLEAFFKTLTRKPQQEQTLLHYLQLVPVLSQPGTNIKGVSRAVMLGEGRSQHALRILLKKGVFEEVETIVPRYELDGITEITPIRLNAPQSKAYNEILHAFDKNRTVLLHGITGSGKTEIYIQLIQQRLQQGKQVLLLIPEIALTTQVVNRLKKAIGLKVGVYHSKFSSNERVEVWHNILSGKLSFIVGARSAVFLPFNNLGLIIVDEEHDPSYKQNEPSPRYNARDIALMLGRHHSTDVLLGSATPSAESYVQTIGDKYDLVTLNQRFGKTPLPDIMTVNMRKIRKNRTKTPSPFSPVLLKEIRQTLQENQQVLLFQNRRGYAPIAQCQECGWTPECLNCAVKLTYHQFNNKLTCHYCGHKQSFLSKCPACGSTRILTEGYGTERLEEELELHFEHASIQRMDRDTVRTRHDYESIIANFESAKKQILVGTQMIIKGLDFGHVKLVGIVDADRMRYFPDFRSYERTFQLIIQAGGRAGRRETTGKVIIQTTDPSHELFHYIRHHDVKGFMLSQLNDRHRHSYPPYVRLIEVTIKHAHCQKCENTAKALAEQLSKVLDKQVTILGPAEPVVAKIKNEFLRTLLIKITRDHTERATIKRAIRETAERLLAEKQHRSSKIIFNVDPTI